jgi:hypothetical protein
MSPAKSVLLLALTATMPVMAQTVAPASTAPAPAGSVANLEAVTVSGVQPGPGLWKVSKGDHVMYVLGTVSPLPDHMQWKTDEVEDVIAHSQEVIDPPKVTIKADTGFFGKLFLLPSLVGARKNPDDKTLQQTLPTSLYARWLPLKQQYIGNDSGIERWRPIFAALELYDKAIKRSGMNASGGVKNTVRDLAKKHNIKLTETKYQMVITEPRAAVKAFKSLSMNDEQCFSNVLDTVQNQLGAMVARANAWATGDIDLLRKASLKDQREACVTAVTETGLAQKIGLSDLPQKVEDTWMNAAKNALANDAQSFALLPMDQVLGAKGMLAKLKAQGYQVQAPDDDDTQNPESPSP